MSEGAEFIYKQVFKTIGLDRNKILLVGNQCQNRLN
jgi:hypothetical protein